MELIPIIRLHQLFKDYRPKYENVFEPLQTENNPRANYHLIVKVSLTKHK